MKSALGPRSRSIAPPDDTALQVPALQRGLAMLEFLARSAEGATLSELGGELGIGLPSAFRLASALEQLGYLRRDERTKSYSVTRKLLLLGQPHAGERSLVECAVDSLRQVRRATGETTQLCCLAEGRCVIIDQLASVHPFKYIVDLGSDAPTHACAPGKAMLAFLPDDELDTALAHVRFERHTDHTITSRRELMVELERIRAQRFAVDRGEHFDGIHCVAAPLLDRHGHAIAAITIAGPKERIPVGKFSEFGRLIISAADEAARRFIG
jgi:DNA-binding IclR family transcriptional regulator